MSKQKVNDPGEAPAGALPLGFGGNEALGALGRAGDAWVRTCMALQRELTSFASARFRNDVEHATALARCPNAVEFARLQQNWAATALRDYAEQAGHLAQVASDAVVNGVTATTEAAGRAGDVALAGCSAD